VADLRQATGDSDEPDRQAAADPGSAAQLTPLGVAFARRARAAEIELESYEAFVGEGEHRHTVVVECWTIWPATTGYPGLYVMANGAVVYGSAVGSVYTAPLPHSTWPEVMDALAGYLASRGA